MRICLTACLFLALGLIPPIHMSSSSLPGELEGSGNDLDTSGSGSGDWSDQDEITNVVDQSNVIYQTFDETQWPENDPRSGYVILANSKSFLENKQILAAVVAGGVTGVILAAVLTAIFIYKWRIKDEGGYILGQRTHSEDVV